ncbi:MAG: hypothetical protein ACQKBY_11440 [Verrucomicrobiales bacterium]
MSGLSPDQLASQLPVGGMFSERQWLWSPEPFELSAREKKQIGSLGHVLSKFQESCELIYRRSVKGSAPEWIAELLDTGKPTWLVDHQNEASQIEVRPRVIRPDLLLQEKGFALSELDAVPGGIGTLAWLNQRYEAAGFEVLGGAEGMIEGFRSLLPEGGEILVSEESGDYRPEMEWLAGELGEAWQVIAAEEWDDHGAEHYRFFELFDWEQIPRSRELAATGRVTPPFKPHFEEKMWLALLHNPSLRALWEETMRGSHLRRMKELVPYGWVVDPAPVPPHAALPRLDLASWAEVGELSQSQRRLVLKLSGFSELAWGAKSVLVGHDSSGKEWQEAVAQACADFEEQPWLMQEFAEARLVEHPYYDHEGQLRTMNGRVRLCPYYFLDATQQVNLGGCLATIVPADKKKIHGMKDGILVPCC